MKKIVMLVGALVLCTASFAKESGVVDVIAVVEPGLKLTTKEVDFGIVAPDTIKTEPEKNGFIIIEGVEEKNVSIKLSTDGVEIKDGTIVPLYGNNTGSKLEYTPVLKIQKGSKVDEISLGSLETVALDTYGNLNIMLYGQLNVPSDVEYGKHVGHINVEVEYTD